ACEEKISVSVNSFKLSGRIDRIEQRNDKIVIVDYKTGANQAYLKIDLRKLEIDRRESWGQAIGSLQLPFYTMLYSEQGGTLHVQDGTLHVQDGTLHVKEKTPIKELEALFLFLGRSKIGKEIELPLFNGAAPDEVYAPLKTVILKLLQEITDPSLPFGPASDQKRICPTCDYQYICGTQWILR
ncbi:MAG TPA: PD-(D/E)XK nuclease family protein, partial [Candidatus Manganitrophaceae bacterium]|nr:PD-(D/E)XK nuclease family protein [Candidatus Manganitrophaceae bacterium]